MVLVEAVVMTSLSGALVRVTVVLVAPAVMVAIVILEMVG